MFKKIFNKQILVEGPQVLTSLFLRSYGATWLIIKLNLLQIS